MTVVVGVIVVRLAFLLFYSFFRHVLVFGVGSKCRRAIGVTESIGLDSVDDMDAMPRW